MNTSLSIRSSILSLILVTHVIKSQEHPFKGKLHIKINKLDSKQMNESYNYSQFAFCESHLLEMIEPSECNVLCVKKYSREEIDELAVMIDEGYRVNLLSIYI